MVELSRQRIAEAVNLLVFAPNCNQLIAEMTAILERWDTHPMAYAGKLSALNAMIDVGLANRNAFERLVKLIEQRRREIPETRRSEYQRDLMRARRARVAKALELHELLDGKVLSGGDRVSKAASIQEGWRAARDRFIADKGKLSWAERNAAAGEFWDRIDHQLDTALKEERQKRRARK
jgi:hypothetical protein